MKFVLKIFFLLYSVYVFGQCDTNITVQFVSPVCQGSSQIVYASWYQGFSYQWSDSSQVLSNSNSMAFSSSDVGLHKLFLRVSIPGCPIRYDTISIRVLPHPQDVVDLGTDRVICKGVSVSLDATVQGATNYLWSNGDITETTVITESGLYWVRVTNICGIGRDTVDVLVKPNPTVDLGPDRVECSGTTFTLDAGEGYDSYLWSTGETTQIIDVKVRNVSISVVVDSGGCTASDTITITDCPVNPQVPTAFSPNGDGKNDVLYVRGNNIASVDLKIYNRLGILVYHGTSVSSGWDGTFQGSDQDPDVYIYILSAKLADGTVYEKTGHVALIK